MKTIIAFSLIFYLTTLFRGQELAAWFMKNCETIFFWGW